MMKILHHNLCRCYVDKQMSLDLVWLICLELAVEMFHNKHRIHLEQPGSNKLN